MPSQSISLTPTPLLLRQSSVLFRFFFFVFVSLQFRFVLLGFVLVAIVVAYAGLCLWRFVCLRFSTLSFVDIAAAAVADVAGDNSDYLNTCYMHVRYQSEI